MNKSIKNTLRDIAEKSPKSMHRAATRVVISNVTKFIMTEEEVLRGERDSAERDRLTERYMQRFPEEAAQIEKRIAAQFENNANLQSVSGEEAEEIKKDMRFCRFAYGTQIDEYLYMDFRSTNRDPARRRGIVSDVEQHVVRLCANDFTHAELSDKARAYELLKKYYKRDTLTITKPEDWEAFRAFLETHAQFMVKRVFSSRGIGVEKVRAEELSDPRAYFDALVKEGKILLEDLIVQSEDVAQFNPESVNTARISTYLTKDGPITPWGVLRTGRRGSFIDNCAAGGVMASIDTATGITNSDGCDESGSRYEFHPDSGVRMKGFQLPDWEQALAICREAAVLTPDIKYLSWDLAHSRDNGWMMVEVNTSGQFLQQIGLLRGIKDEIRDVLDRMDLLLPYRFLRT